METLIAIFAEGADVFSLVFGVVGGLIISAGAVLALFRFLVGAISTNHKKSDPFAKKSLDPIRVEFGRYINLGLEFFIAKDVLETMFLPTWTDIGQLFALVIIRTMISYFLMHEIEKIEAKHT